MEENRRGENEEEDGGGGGGGDGGHAPQRSAHPARRRHGDQLQTRPPARTARRPGGVLTRGVDSDNGFSSSNESSEYNSDESEEERLGTTRFVVTPSPPRDSPFQRIRRDSPPPEGLRVYKGGKVFVDGPIPSPEWGQEQRESWRQPLIEWYSRRGRMVRRGYLTLELSFRFVSGEDAGDLMPAMTTTMDLCQGILYRDVSQILAIHSYIRIRSRGGVGMKVCYS